MAGRGFEFKDVLNFVFEVQLLFLDELKMENAVMNLEQLARQNRVGGSALGPSGSASRKARA